MTWSWFFRPAAVTIRSTLLILPNTQMSWQIISNLTDALIIMKRIAHPKTSWCRTSPTSNPNTNQEFKGPGHLTATPTQHKMFLPVDPTHLLGCGPAALQRVTYDPLQVFPLTLEASVRVQKKKNVLNNRGPRATGGQHF